MEKKLKWAAPKLRLANAFNTADKISLNCISGSGDPADCNNGASAGYCTAGTSATGTCQNGAAAAACAAGTGL